MKREVSGLANLVFDSITIAESSEAPTTSSSASEGMEVVADDAAPAAAAAEMEKEEQEEAEEKKENGVKEETVSSEEEEKGDMGKLGCRVSIRDGSVWGQVISALLSLELIFFLSNIARGWVGIRRRKERYIQGRM